MNRTSAVAVNIHAVSPLSTCAKAGLASSRPVARTAKAVRIICLTPTMTPISLWSFVARRGSVGWLEDNRARCSVERSAAARHTNALELDTNAQFRCTGRSTKPPTGHYDMPGARGRNASFTGRRLQTPDRPQDQLPLCRGRSSDLHPRRARRG